MQHFTSTPSSDRGWLTYSRPFGHAVAFMALASLLFLGSTRPADAQEEPDRRWNSEACLGCHDGSDSVVTFPSGEELGIGIDGQAFRDTHAFTDGSGDASRSFAGGVQCAHCHTNIVQFPHDDVTAPDVATYTAGLANTCRQCHWRQYTVELDGTHALVPLDMRDQTPGCIDCHDRHAPEALAVDSPEMQQTCQGCHDEPVTEVLAIHTLDPTQVEEASAPPIIVFYLLIVGGLVALIALMWGVVVLSERTRARSQPSEA